MRYLAALVPFAITIQFALVGFGLMKDEAAVQAMSRSGDPKEILKGPLYYGIVFVILTILFWTDSPNGIIALMMVCGGDGLAEILGTEIWENQAPLESGEKLDRQLWFPAWRLGAHVRNHGDFHTSGGIPRHSWQLFTSDHAYCDRIHPG